jgi:hypothetical protein
MSNRRTKSPDYLHWVLFEHWVCCDNRPAFFNALCDQHSVEGVVMVQGQSFELSEMSQTDRKNFDVVFRQLFENVFGGRPWQSKLIPLRLD